MVKISLPKHRWGHVQNKPIYSTWEISWTWLETKHFPLLVQCFLWDEREKKTRGRFKKAQLENKTLKFPFQRPCSLALTPFSTRVKGVFWLSGLAKLFLPGLSSEAKQSKKLEWGAHSWCSKKLRTKWFQKPVIKHSNRILFNHYLLYKKLAALMFPHETTTHKATPTQVQEMDVSDPHSHAPCVNLNSTS